jgi:hypothetical protein
MSYNILNQHPYFRSDIIGPSHKKIKAVSGHLSIMGMAYPHYLMKVEVPVNRKTAQWGTTLMVS